MLDSLDCIIFIWAPGEPHFFCWVQPDSRWSHCVSGALFYMAQLSTLEEPSRACIPSNEEPRVDWLQFAPNGSQSVRDNSPQSLCEFKDIFGGTRLTCYFCQPESRGGRGRTFLFSNSPRISFFSSSSSVLSIDSRSGSHHHLRQLFAPLGCLGLVLAGSSSSVGTSDELTCTRYADLTREQLEFPRTVL